MSEENSYSIMVEAMYVLNGRDVNEVEKMSPQEVMAFNLVHHMYHFDRCGKRVYKFDRDLINMLCDTKVVNMDIGLTQLPFGSIYLDLSESDFKVYNEHSGYHELEGVYITESNRGGQRQLRFMLCGLPKDDVANDALLYFQYMLAEEGTIEDSIGKSTNDYVNKGHSPHNRVDLEKEVDGIRDFIFACILYIGCSEVRYDLIDPSGKLKALKTEQCSKKVIMRDKQMITRIIKNMSGLPYTYYRSDIDIRPPLPDGDMSLQERIGGQHSYRYSVQGHYKRVWVGEGRKESKLKHVKPHMRGSDVGKVIERNRRVMA